MSIEYSKKVKQHFLNPKNVGEIKNPDGIGKVGNPVCGDVMYVYIKVKDNVITDIKFKTMGCLPPEEEVTLGNEWKPISEVVSNEVILDGSANKTLVKKLHVGDYEGQMIKITPFVSTYNSFSVTPEHPVLGIKRKFLKCRKSSNKCDWLRIDEKELISSKPCYIEAGYLEKGDYIVFPKTKHVLDSEVFNIEIMKLLGYYLAEGYISPVGVINFALNKNERKLIDEIKQIIKKITGKEMSERIRGNVSEIRVCSTKLSNFLIKNCGKYAKNKLLSEEVLLLPFKKQIEMINTFIKGDGNTYKRRVKDSETFRMDTTSVKLAVQIQQMLARGNIFSSIKKFNRPETTIEGRKVPSHTLYNISFKNERKHKFVRETKNYFLVPIRETQISKFKGKVYNIEVKGDNPSYLVRGFTVHNCAAAIATSSMITELAKGKTLEEAEKITNKDVAKSLEGLPPIKMHCSNLAADALRDAIKDYRSKK